MNNFGDIILADFGLAVHPESMRNSFKGSFFYMSPEILQNEEYGFAIDIWSFGCVVLELYTLRKAFDGKNLAEVTRKIVEYEITFPSFRNEPEIEFIVKKYVVCFV